METHKKRTVEEFVQKYATPLSIIAAGVFISMTMYYYNPSNLGSSAVTTVDAQAAFQESVIPSSGVMLPITWGDLGAKMVEAGAIDPDKMAALYKDRG